MNSDANAGLAGIAHYGIGGVQPPVATFSRTMAAKDHRVLRHHGEPARDGARVGAAQVDAVDAHGARLRVVEAEQQLEYRWSCRAGRPDQRDLFRPVANLQGEIIERGGCPDANGLDEA
jgi:hypothetical protein